MLLFAAIVTVAAGEVGLRVNNGDSVTGKLEFVGNREGPSQTHFRLETTPGITSGTSTRSARRALISENPHKLMQTIKQFVG